MKFKNFQWTEKRRMRVDGVGDCLVDFATVDVESGFGPWKKRQTIGIYKADFYSAWRNEETGYPYYGEFELNNLADAALIAKQKTEREKA